MNTTTNKTIANTNKRQNKIAQQTGFNSFDSLYLSVIHEAYSKEQANTQYLISQKENQYIVWSITNTTKSTAAGERYKHIETTSNLDQAISLIH